ncbi:hypothetical protein FRUB_05627 [Fimbriiglobus ruber]|uniref:Cytochrome c domain-containing protein n=2 Tax=Fimbriiglobus ruber TaxID=1908690 RepID=A0A225DUB5_9BACT|nr:hypothetical protein FRUB_05627 [Fimbriiglobus ruber]
MGVDGNADSRWCADGGSVPQWFQVDLGKPEDLTGCRVTWEMDQKAYLYTIEGSADAKVWKPLAGSTDGKLTTQIQTHKFTATGIRYVKLNITELPEGAWASFYELEVFGPKMVPAAKFVPPSPKTGDLLKTVKAAAGFDATIFAAPPDISYPTCLAAAPDGTLFVGVDLNGSLGAKAGKGKVVRCIDTDGDGKADQFNKFCDVESPRGLWWDDNTLYVLHPPFVTAYRDTDGDGVADKVEDLVTGLGFDLKTRGADHTTNGFRFAIDGFFYIAVGDYGAVKAVGKDGRTIQLHGGGIVRVRPDGSGLEIVTRGQRNIYDVAVSPTLDLFTRDNTNDGGGWDVRLSHGVPTVNFGYPTLFVNFPDEIIQPLADYGGGSPCGALFLDEPGFPKGYGHALYFCEWGRSQVYRHPLTPNGATWKVGQEPFVNLPRPTDLDADGTGHLYISSWKDGGFDFSNPNVGFVARVTPKGWKPAAFPDLKKATDDELVTHLASDSQVRRTYAQREILRRGAKAAFFAEKLTPLATGDQSLSVKVAAIFTLNQLAGVDTKPTLVKLTADATVREYALRALADAPEHRSTAPTQPFLDALADPSPRARTQAVIGLGRIGNVDNAGAILPLTADSDPVISHVAVQALVTLRASAACLAALDSADTKLAPGALRVLQTLHEPAVVDGLITRLKATTDTTRRRGLLVALARLANKEATWDGKWWTTRPDTTGPYYKPVTWAESPKIATALRDEVAKADADGLRWLLPQLIRHRIEMPEVTKAVVELAQKDAGLRRAVVEVMAARAAPPAEMVPLFAEVAKAADESPAARATAIRGLGKLASQPARDALVEALTTTDKLPKELEAAWAEFARDGKRVGELPQYTKLTTAAAPGARELAWGVIASIADRNLGDPKARQAANAAVKDALAKPDAAPAVINAITRLGLTSFAPDLRRLAAGTDARAAAAKDAMAALKLDAAGGASGPLVGTLKYEDTVAQAIKIKGSADLGAKLFGRIGCANCHTVSTKEPLKGPLLAGITTRYNRTELLESILKPSAKIAQGFESFQFNLLNGKTVTGFIVRESGAEVEVRDATGATVVVKKDEIDERKPGKLSVMPEKLVDELTTTELASILAYLESLKTK